MLRTEAGGERQALTDACEDDTHHEPDEYDADHDV
jgi:hypothetical protein